MSSNKIHKLKSIFTATGGCGCRPNPTDIIHPQPKSKSSLSDQNSTHLLSSSASSSATRHGGVTEDDDFTFTPLSFNIDASPHRRRDHTIFSKSVASCQKIEDSFAVIKDSDDPYQDFRQSMLQMIFEKEIYSRDDLQQLLDCFLKLNSPHHHEVIVQAFVEIWNGAGGAAAVGGKDTTEAPPCSSTSYTFHVRK